MCGIAGILSFNSQPVSIAALKKMTDAIAHRGPDGEGQWQNSRGQVALGHRRLSIIDLSEHGKQPMHYLNTRYTITFNGEIYNYVELKNDLVQQGYSFQSGSDTEVLLALYDLKKEKCLQDLDGMFAFAIWDEQEQSLFCARDRFGEKPFYYYHEEEKEFSFASEMKALWAAGKPRNIDLEMLSAFFKNSVVMDASDLGRTFYTNIRQLKASHFLKIDRKNKITIEPYYSLENISQNKSITEKEAAQQFLQLLTDSVRLRLRSDVPVGSSLSGGLDSSSIVMLMDKLKGDTTNQNTFSARFKGFKKDEGNYIHKVVDACKNVTCHEVWPDDEQLVHELDKVFFHQEEPFGSGSIFAQWKVMELAKQKGVTVLLDGQGADEQLAGYIPHYSGYLNQLFYHQKSNYKNEWEKYNFYHGANYPQKNLIDEETFPMTIGRWKRKITGAEMPYKANQLQQNLLADTTGFGLKTLLRYADRNAMAHSREVRLPFLSHHLVEFVFSLPDNYKLQNGWTKYVLRKAMENILPQEITWRVDKIGYVSPQDKWLENAQLQSRIKLARGKSNDLFNDKIDTSISEWKLLMLSFL